MFELLCSNILRGKDIRNTQTDEGTDTQMATTTSSSSKSTDSKTTRSKPSQSKTETTGNRNVTETAISYVQQTGQRVVDVPVGAVLTARERVNGAVEPWTKTETRSKELSGLRRQAKTELGKFERRGGQARRKATERVRSTGSRVSERARKVETRVKDGRSRIEGGLKRARSTVQGRTSSPASS